MNQLVIHQTWRFLYAKKDIKKCLTKTGHPLPNVTAYIITTGQDYAECYAKARRDANFPEHRLIGSLPIN